MTLRLRLALFIALAIVVAVFAQQGLSSWVLQATTRGTIEAPLARYARFLSTAAPSRLSVVGDQFEGFQTRARLRRGDQVLAEIGGPFPQCPRPSSARAQLCDPFWVVSGPAQGGRSVDAAMLALNSAALLQRYEQALLFSSVVLAVLGAGVAWGLASRALSPLSALTRTARRVSESGDLSVRVAPPASGELAELARAFNRMLERLAAFRWRETEFTRHASHEFRTPLTAMRLELSSYRSGYASAEEVMPSLEREVARMSRLSEALLLLAREAPIQRAPVDLAALARDLAGPAGASYHGEECLVVEGHSVLIARAVENLLENAQRHAAGAGVQVRVEAQEGVALLVVSDAGPGWQVGVTNGHGFGLGVVERIMQAHGGGLTLNPAQPHGLRAILSFPLAGGSAPSAHPAALDGPVNTQR